MAWTSPPTFTTGALTAAQLNILSADLLETAPAKATANSQYFVATAANTIAARSPTSYSANLSDTTTSTSYIDLGGPVVTVTSGPNALVLMQAQVSNNTNGVTSSIGLDISGATTSPAATVYISLTTAAAGQQMTAAGVRMVTGLTAGSNTFMMMYVVSAGTGSFNRRFMAVLPF